MLKPMQWTSFLRPLLLVALVCSTGILRAETESVKSLDDIPKVKWLSPQLIKHEVVHLDEKDNEGGQEAQRVDFVLSGLSDQSGVIKVLKKNFLFSRDGKEFKKFAIKDIFKGKGMQKIQADEKFELAFRGFEGFYQVPLQFEYFNGPVISTALNFGVAKDEIAIAKANSPVKANMTAGEESEKKMAKLDKDIQANNVIFVGGGVNLLRYNQTSSGIGSDVEYQSFDMPSLFFKYQRILSSLWTVDLTVETSPGVVASGSNISVSAGSYDWNIVTLQGLYTPWSFNGLVGEGTLGIVFGVQYHQVPFIRRVTITEAEIVSNNLSMLTGGVSYAEDFWRRWKFEGYMRYQYPISTGSVFSITPNFAFDGSVCLSRKIFARSHVGLFWFGQWHDYEFLTFDRLSSQDIQGEQSLFFSRLELRFGFSF